MADGGYPAGWYADPWTSAQLRFWDGQTWTPHVRAPVPPAPSSPTDALSIDVDGGAVESPTLEPETSGSGTTTRATTTQPWRDLAANRPGELVRARAEELRRAAPIRTMLARLIQVHNDERAFRVGARGEEIVGRRLDRIGPGWQVLHSVQVGSGDSDIDHVVMGPGGVFTVNTKHHPRGRAWVAQGTIRINNQKVPYLRNSRHEAQRAARLLSGACGFPVEVQGVVVIIATRFTLKQQPADVFVGGPRSVVRWLRRKPANLGPDEVATIYEHARRDTTWRTAG